MPDKFETILAEYEARAEQENELMHSLGAAGMARRDEFLLPIGKDVADILGSLIIGTNSKYIVEVGASYGYSTLFLASFADKTNGIVHSFEIDERKVEYARLQINRAGLADRVIFHIGDAIEKLHSLEKNIDFALLDVWKELYIPAFDIIYPKLKTEGIIVADNMIFPPIHQEDALLYRNHVRSYNDMEACLLNIGHGIDIAVKNK